MKYIKLDCNLCNSKSYTIIATGIDFEYKSFNDEFTIVQCNKCGLVYLNPRPASSELNVIYPESYIPYRFDEYLPGIVNKLRMMIQRLKVRSLKKFVKSENAVIWDVGCGGGFFLECLREYGLPSWKLVGVDISNKAINKIKEKGFKAILGRFETLDSINKSVDVIVLNQVIEHLDNPAAVIAKANSILKKNGCIFIETPSLDGWDAKIFKSRYWGGWHFPRHWTLFTSKTLCKLLEKNGFKVIEKTYLLSPNFWAQSFHHWLMDKGFSERIAKLMDCKNPLVLVFFSVIDLIQKMFWYTSNMRIIGKKYDKNYTSNIL